MGTASVMNYYPAFLPWKKSISPFLSSLSLFLVLFYNDSLYISDDESSIFIAYSAKRGLGVGNRAEFMLYTDTHNDE